MSRPLLVLALAFSSCSSAFASGPQRRPDFPVTSEQRAALVQGIFDELRSKYVFPERLDAAFAILAPRWTPEKLKGFGRAGPLLERLNADLTEVFHDGHLSVSPAEGIPDGMFGDPDAPDPAADAQMKAMEKSFHYGLVRAEVLRGNVGYLEIKAFASASPGQAQAYADAMAFVRDTEALILDVRGNGGGDGESVADLVGYLLEKKTLLQEETFRIGGAVKTSGHFSKEPVTGPRYGTARPVFVLTAGRCKDPKEHGCATFSAAEELAYDLQTQKRATVVGEPSGGGANHNRFERIAKDFAISIPYGTVKNPVTGTNWEGTGVQPDVRVPAKSALATAHRLAVEKVLAVEANPDRKAQLTHLLAELQ